MNEMNKKNELLEKALCNLEQALKDSIHPKLNIMLKEKHLELKHKTNISRYKIAMEFKRINQYNKALIFLLKAFNSGLHLEKNYQKYLTEGGGAEYFTIEIADCYEKLKQFKKAVKFYCLSAKLNMFRWGIENKESLKCIKHLNRINKIIKENILLKSVGIDKDNLFNYKRLNYVSTDKSYKNSEDISIIEEVLGSDVLTQEDRRDIWELLSIEEVNIRTASIKYLMGSQIAFPAYKRLGIFDDIINEETGELMSIEQKEIVIKNNVKLNRKHISKLIKIDAKAVFLFKTQKSVFFS
jgi:tetratricopeptide (TPR) repeat protein